MTNGRLEQQLAFILEADRLKTILRRSRILDQSRYENDAEHTWHLMLMAVMLKEHANAPNLDLMRVLKMLVIHDIVEIDAGDTFAYDEKGHEDKFEREEAAAKRIFGLLPSDQAGECYALWREFEDRETPESKYAAAIDRLQPMLLNFHSEGAAWQLHGVRSEQVYKRNAHIEEGSNALWLYAKKVIEEAVEKSYLARS